MMLAHVAQMASSEDMLAVWEMGTYAGARIMGMEETYGVSEGKNADLVVFDAPSAIDALLDLAEKAYVFKEGSLLFRNRTLSESYI
jgi:cytosine deaminase